MIVIDEYLAARAVARALPDNFPNEDLLLPTSRHWRLLQALHAQRGGRLSRLLAPLSEGDREALRYPHPEVLEVLDPRPLLDEAALLAARFGNTGWLVGETLAAGRHQGALWFGDGLNVGSLLGQAAEELQVEIHVVGS